MESKKVSLIKYEEPVESVSKAINLSGALDNLKKGDKVFIKPNIVFWATDASMPPWGVITTTRVVEDVVRELINRGAGQIIIGEGPITQDPKDRETALDAFETLGYNKMAAKYGIKVVNNFKKEFRQVDLGDGIKLNFSANLLDADYVVSLPVLKTHAQAVVSLSQKNFKGCLDMESRKLCHSDNPQKNLDFHIAKFINILPRSCAIIDGIYTLERGPAYTGKARRSNILIASQDLLAADMVGAAALGIEPDKVPHLVIACKNNNITPSLESVEIVGEALENVASLHQHDFPYNAEGNLPYNLERIGVTGLSFPKFDYSLCTYCSGLIGLLQMAIASAWKGVPFDKVEILTGKIKKPTPNMNHTVLLGKCQVKLNKNNPDIKNPLLVPGCPPKIDKLILNLKKAGIQVDQDIFDNYDSSPGHFMHRYKGKPEFSHKFYRSAV